MSLISRLSEKSWQSPGVESHADPAEYRPAASTVGVYVYFGVAMVVFSLMTAAYLVRMGLPSVMDHGGGGDWQPMPEPPMLWVNSAVLIVSSITWESARRSAIGGEQGSMRSMSILGAVLGLFFLAGQLMLWRGYQAAGYYLSANPANAFFYLLTAVHGLHLAGGIIACGRTLGQMASETDSGTVRRNVRLCAVYWHFLLLIWIGLVALLLFT